MEDGPASAEHGLARGRARLSQGTPSRQGDVNDLVTHTEKNDRTRLREPRKFNSRHHPQHGNDRGSCASHRLCESRFSSLLQPSAQNGRASDLVACRLDYSGSEESENNALRYRSGAATNRLTSWKG